MKLSGTGATRWAPTEVAIFMKVVRRIAWVTVGFTYFLVSLGGTVRVKNAGLSCPDWPLCYGKVFAFPDVGALLEEAHRYTASIVSALIVALVICALIWARKERQVLIPALIAPVLLAVQIVLGGLTVLWKLPPTIITAHLGTPPAWAVTYHLADINVLHRYIATFVGLVLIWTVVSGWRRRKVAPGQAWIALAAGILFVVQAAVGGLVVLLRRPDLIAALHLALATSVWGLLVILAVLAARQLRAAPRGSDLEKLEEAEPKKERNLVGQTIASYVDLMKPHVTVLLLGTTAAAMAIAAGGLPPLGRMLATLLGGAMAAGSANCINCYIDRDIDQIMGRTQRRSLPSGRVQPAHALIFGIALGTGAFIVLAAFVNLLSATLACSAILFYVFIYTLWLKRSSVQNIVIGGAAGAVPVLVGWAAVTNTITLPAIWLFAIIFYWTPPHFWALSLLIQKDYEKAHIPMLPVVMGEGETRKQIFLYSLLLLAVTLVLFGMRDMGYFYLVAALVLGGILVYMSLRLLREKSKSRAKTLFWYSNCYLALIFAAMVLDRTIH